MSIYEGFLWYESWCKGCILIFTVSPGLSDVLFLVDTGYIVAGAAVDSTGCCSEIQ